MKYENGNIFGRIFIPAAWLLLSLLLTSCAGMNPKRVDVTISPESPAPKMTSFDRALSDLGEMTLVYGCDLLNIMFYGGQDYTGTSAATGGEIPGDIMEMIKSVLNSVGGNVYYIPYNPNMIDTMVRLGWTSYEGKQIPHVILTGGITEFDRGLSTRGGNDDLGMETKPFTHAPKWTPGDTLGIEYAYAMKESLARITLDFNLIDFQRNIGIPKMQTVNSIHVHKATAEKELAITLFGPTFGLKGSIKKVEGRHAAVRLLAQLSIIQIVGRYFDLPYWNLLPGAKADPVVAAVLADDFSEMDDLVKAIKIQELLFLIGYDIGVTGEFDEATLAALKHFDPGYDPAQNGFDFERYFKLYCAVPVNPSARQRRYQFNQLLEEFIASMNAPNQQPSAEASPGEPGGESGNEPNGAGDARESDHQAKTHRETMSPNSDNNKSEDELASDLVELLGNSLGSKLGGRSKPEKNGNKENIPTAGSEW